MRVIAILILVMMFMPIIVNMIPIQYKGQHRKGKRNGYKQNNTVHSSASLSTLDFATKEDDQGASLEWRSYRSKEGTGADTKEE